MDLAAGGSAVAAEPSIQLSASAPRRGVIGMTAAVLRCAVLMATEGVKAIDTVWRLGWQQHERTSGPIAASASLRSSTWRSACGC